SSLFRLLNGPLDISSARESPNRHGEYLFPIDLESQWSARHLYRFGKHHFSVHLKPEGAGTLRSDRLSRFVGPDRPFLRAIDPGPGVDRFRILDSGVDHKRKGANLIHVP